MHRFYYMLLSLFLSLITSACSPEDQLLESSPGNQNIEFRVATRSFVSNESHEQTTQESAIKNLSLFLFDRNGQELVQQSRQHPIQDGKVVLSVSTANAQGPLNAYMVANEKGFPSSPMTETELLSYKTQCPPSNFITDGFPMSSAAVTIQSDSPHTSASVTLERTPSAIYVQVDASEADGETITNNAYQVEVEGLQITEGALFHNVASSMEAQPRNDYSSKLTAVNTPENIAYFYQSSQIKIHITPRDSRLGEAKTVTVDPESSKIRNKKFLLQIKPVKLPDVSSEPPTRNMTFTVAVAEWKTDVIITEVPIPGTPVPPPPSPMGDVVLFAEGVSITSGWYDQNKSRVGDSELCWACAESNMIQWWQDRYIAAGKPLPPDAPNGVIPGRENALSRRLAIFENFHMREFENRGSAILRGIPQYFTTYYPEIFSDFKPFFSEGTYASSKSFRNLKEFSDFVVTGLKERGVVGLGLIGHATTLWGVTYNTETGLVKDIFMTDSDDRDNGKIYHGLWENRSVKERADGRPVLAGIGTLIEDATILYAYPGRSK